MYEESPSRPSISKLDKDFLQEHVEEVSNNKKWPGLPRGVKFVPSDEELLWHLLAAIGEAGHEPHPYIDEFITLIDDDGCFGDSLPQKLPGVKQDGSLSYFFHRPFKAQENRNQKRRKLLSDALGTVQWNKIGKITPVYVDGVHKGSKMALILYMALEGSEKPEKTNWMMHQYHVGVGEDTEGELVISKIFYQVTCHEMHAEEITHAGHWESGNNYPSEDSKDTISHSQTPPDSKQKGNVILPCTEAATRRQSSCILDMEGRQSCLSDNAELGDHCPTKVLECRTDIVVDCDLKDARYSGKTYCNLANQANSEGLYLMPAPKVKCETYGQPEVDFHTSNMLDNSVVSVHSTHVMVEPFVMHEDTCKAVTDNISPASVGMSEPLCESETDDMDNITLQERYKLMRSDMNKYLECYKKLDVNQDMEQCAAGSASLNKIHGQDFEVIPTDERHEDPLCHLELSGNISETKNEDCPLHFTQHDDARCLAVPLMNFPDGMVSGSPLAAGKCLVTPKLEPEYFDENKTLRTSKTWPASASEVRLLVIPQEPTRMNDMDTAECSISAPILHKVTSPDNPASGICKPQQCQKQSCNYPGESSITGGILHDSIQGQLQYNGNSRLFDAVPSVSPLELKAESLEESNTNCILVKNTEELASPFSATELNSNKNFLTSLSVIQNHPIIPKLEPVDSSLLAPCEGPPSIFPEIAMVKSECIDDLTTDFLDHIPLSRRMHMLTTRNFTDLSCDKNLTIPLQTLSPPESDTSNVLNANKKRFSLRRKRKKTVTDSVKTALEEDAPGLLQVLIDKGITVEEIKLYGVGEDDASLLSCPLEDSFEELQSVITKLFPEGPSIFKFPSVRQTKASKANYCLACLISLIEQARYLLFRQSPVEWGWCRDLQSFIFVFERHNRIVLERPEYGYATYFFELVESLPVDWQIKRLVTAMKLPCCSRTVLLENKPLLVGKDLTEGEAHIMEEYGWIRNSGLGTMLSYCDRVVHDRKNERYSLEWKAKIGKLLMKGHDSGRTVLYNLPKKVAHYLEYQNPGVKLET